VRNLRLKSDNTAAKKQGPPLMWIILAALCVVFAGCATPRTPPAPESSKTPDMTMVLAAGDEIRISFLGAAELNTTQTIRRDGKITLQMLGEVTAAGKTANELQAELLSKYAPQLQVKEIAVIVTSPAPIFVSGAVREGGQLNMERPITVLEAVMAAGGFEEREAKLKNVLVIRHRRGKWQGYAVDVTPILAGQKDDVFYLQPMDIVYVPRTTIVKVNQWIDQHISRMLPSIPLRFLP